MKYSHFVVVVFVASLSEFCKTKVNTFITINEKNIENLPAWNQKKTKLYNRSDMWNLDIDCILGIDWSAIVT